MSPWSPDDAHRLCHELDAVLEQQRLTILFQPIASLRGRSVLGYEALVRGPADSALHNPLVLFSAAERCQRLAELDRLCQRLATARFLAMGLPGLLFLNMVPSLLLENDDHAERLIGQLGASGLPPQRVVLELSERYPLEDAQGLRRALEPYSQAGHAIAIDDLGAGYASLRLWSQLRPAYVKVDQHFVRGLDDDPVKREFVRSMGEIARGVGAQLVAEGVETAGELNVLAELGIELAQGYHLARPLAEPPLALPVGLFERDLPLLREAWRWQRGQTVGELARPNPTITPDTSMDAVGALFRQRPDLNTLPVVTDGRVAGAVQRIPFSDIYLSRYGRDLYGRKPVEWFMQADPLTVEHGLQLADVSRLLTDVAAGQVEHEFVVTRGGQYLGMVRVLDLLRRITDLQVRAARHANPLTLLPGNVPVYECIDDLLRRPAQFAVAYCDIDHFKPFNDVYGYSRGDEVIKRLAELAVQHCDGERDLVGHIGGDDFVLVLGSDDWASRCECLLTAFNAAAAEFYSDEDRAAGGVWDEDRRGQAQFFPLLGLSIGVVLPDPGRCRSHHDVAALAAEAKHQAKLRRGETLGGALYIDRRRGPDGAPGTSETPPASAVSA
jgi:EAL domain-containing protein (putative c-di-GMP-specific phosphodiesterase class I)/GGDEF domain-containing protein